MLGETLKLTDCRPHINQPAAAKSYKKSYTYLLNAAAFWLQPGTTNFCDVTHLGKGLQQNVVIYWLLPKLCYKIDFTIEYLAIWTRRVSPCSSQNRPCSNRFSHFTRRHKTPGVASGMTLELTSEKAILMTSQRRQTDRGTSNTNYRTAQRKHMVIGGQFYDIFMVFNTYVNQGQMDNCKRK